MKCFDCKNKTICKFTENTEGIEKAIDEIKISICSPIRIKVECNSYVKCDLGNTGGMAWNIRGK
jgi:hypothetical protein